MHTRSHIWRLGLWSAVIVLSMAAWFMTQYLMTQFHAPLRRAASSGMLDGIFAGICGGEDADAGATCKDVVTSGYGYITLPWPVMKQQAPPAHQDDETAQPSLSLGKIKLPIAQVGQAYYTFILVWFLFTGIPRRESRGWHVGPMIFSVGALAASLYYMWVMAFELEEWCRMCLLLHAVDLVLCVAILLLWPAVREKSSTQVPSAAPETSPGLKLSQALVTLLCILALVWSSFRTRALEMETAQALLKSTAAERLLHRLQNDTTFLLGGYEHSARVQIPRRDSEMSRGNPRARHELLIFSDLQCPACHKFESNLLGDILKLWGGQMKFTFRHYPLCPQCNPGSRINHAQACNAAYAVEAARIVGGPSAFWEMHDLILARHDDINRAGFDPARFETYASELGLDPAQFRQAYQGPEVRQVVSGDIAMAKSLGITGTPTAFVDGRRLTNYQLQTANLKFWEALARQHLQTVSHNDAAP